MKSESLRRIVLYGAAALASAGLLSLGHEYQGEPDVDTLLNGADALTLVGAHDKAIVECLKVLERDPGNLRAHLLLALSRDRSGDLVAAAETYRESLPHADRAEMRLEIELSVADCLRRAGRADESIAECGRIERETGTGDARLFAVRGLALAAKGETALAVESLAEAVSKSPGEPTFEKWLERARRGDRFEPPLPPPDSKDPLR